MVWYFNFFFHLQVLIYFRGLWLYIFLKCSYSHHDCDNTHKYLYIFPLWNISFNIVFGLLVEPLYEKSHFWKLNLLLTHKIAPIKGKFPSRENSFIMKKCTPLECMSTPQRLECFSFVPLPCTDVPYLFSWETFHTSKA